METYRCKKPLDALGDDGAENDTKKRPAEFVCRALLLVGIAFIAGLPTFWVVATALEHRPDFELIAVAAGAVVAALGVVGAVVAFGRGFFRVSGATGLWRTLVLMGALAIPAWVVSVIIGSLLGLAYVGFVGRPDANDASQAVALTGLMLGSISTPLLLAVLVRQRLRCPGPGQRRARPLAQL